MDKYPPDAQSDALAWFITNDETNDEEYNAYWLRGVYVARQFFSCEEEIDVRTKRHDVRMDAWKTDAAPKPYELKDTCTAHVQVMAAARQKEWEKL